MGVDLIMVTSEHISQVYLNYMDSLLDVNRTYQRKLVWTLEEKQSLIDTILKGYPIPLFLFVSKKEKLDDGTVVEKREIIDGLQRLEAIISFINNKFPVIIDGKPMFFNLNGFSGPTPLVHSGKLKQRTPVLDFAASNKFSHYLLAITTVEADTINVEDVFKRINSTGRQLSAQNLRQAGVVSKFSSMVQKIASRLRGDYTRQDIIALEDMEKYSLSSKGLNYGLDVRKIFWTKQGIMNYDGLRRSKDEEIIANICNSILNGYTTGISKGTLDRLYDESSDTYKRNESILTDAKQIWLTDRILKTVEDIDEAIGEAGKSFKKLVTTDEKSYNTDLVFIVIFLAISQLKDSGYVFNGYNEFSKSLCAIADQELSELTTNHTAPWNVETRSRLIERISNRIKKCMDISNYDPKHDEELCELLGRAVVEEQMYDFKLGLTNLADGSFNNRLVEKCMQTLVAMANTKPGNYGYIILGIANDAKASADFEKHYNKKPQKFNDLYITGVEAEATKYYNDVEGYLRKLTSAIESLDCKISSEIIHDVLTNMNLLRYGERVLMVLRLSTKKPLFYNKDLYVRYQSNLKKIDPGSDEYYNMLETFSGQG